MGKLQLKFKMTDKIAHFLCEKYSDEGTADDWLCDADELAEILIKLVDENKK